MISVVVPCYNSGKSVIELVDRILALQYLNNFEVEIILVNDCSLDDTLDKLKVLSEKHVEISVIDLMFNVGQFRALMCGLENSKGDLIITMDDDLQHPPEEIPKLIKALREDEDIDAIFAQPYKKQHSLFRNFGSLIVRIINGFIFKKPKHLTMSSFRILNRAVVNTITAHNTMFPIMGPIILKSTSRIKNIKVQHYPRKLGKSNYNLFSLIKMAFDHIINFSSLPLKMISVIGISSFIISLVLSLYFLIKYLIGGIGVAGWTSNVLFINIYGGLILFSVGIIGEYLIRILFEVNRFPRYYIRKIYKKED